MAEPHGNTVILRDWEHDDIDRYAYWLAPGHRWQALDAPYYPTPTYDPQLADRVRARIDALDWDTPRTRLQIACAETNALLGHVSRYWESVETDWLSIGVVIYDPDHWGRGVGTAALGRWTDYLFAELPHLARLGLRTWSGNHGMMRLAERLGFAEEARFRKARVVDGEHYDALGYGVLREEWAARWPAGFATEIRLAAPP